MIEKLNTYEEKRSKKNPLLSESGRVGARNTELLKGTLEYDNEAPMNTSEVGWNRDNYSSLCLLIGMGTFACSSLRLTQSVRADVEQHKVTKGTL